MSSTVQAQTKWINYNIDDKISVKFPSPPNKESDGTLLSLSKDSTAIMSLIILDLAQIANIDSATLAQSKENPEFVAGLRNLMNSKSHFVQLDEFKLGKWHGFTSYSSSGIATDTRNKYYNVYMLFIGTKLYLFNAILSATADSKIKDYYFSSIILN
jgi:hypothetical protein